jgi:hypothetical protein
MSLVIRLAAILAVAASAGLAETWSGPLVDSKCYGAEQRNVNPTDTQAYADSDIGYEIRYCSPSRKTKFFAIVGEYGDRLKFDASGNAKAAALVQNLRKPHQIEVAVSGEMSGKAIRVDSISPVVHQ